MAPTKTVKKLANKPKTVKKVVSKSTGKKTVSKPKSTGKKTSGEIIKNTNKMLKRNKILGYSALALTALGGLGYLAYQNKDKLFKSKTKEAVKVINQITPTVSTTEVTKIVEQAAENNTPASVVVKQIEEKSDKPLTIEQKNVITESITSIPPPPPQPTKVNIPMTRPSIPKSQAPILPSRQLTTGQIQTQPSIFNVPNAPPPTLSLNTPTSSTSSGRSSFLDSILTASPTTLKTTPNNKDVELILKECNTLIKSCIDNLSKNKKLSKEFTIDDEFIKYIETMKPKEKNDFVTTLNRIRQASSGEGEDQDSKNAADWA